MTNVSVHFQLVFNLAGVLKITKSLLSTWIQLWLKFKCSRSTHIQLGWSLESNQVPAFNLDSTLAEFWAPIFNLYSTHSSHSTTIQLLKLTIFPFQQLKFNYLDEIGWNSTETQLSFSWVSTKLFCLGAALPVSFGGDTKKSVGPFYLVSMPGEVKDPTSPHWNVYLSWTTSPTLNSPRSASMRRKTLPCTEKEEEEGDRFTVVG